MTTDTIQGNKLIAEFMGKTVYPILDTKEGPQWKGEKCDYHNFQLKYRESWDWLMPVVEKIEGQGCIVDMWLCLGRGCKIIKGSFKEPVQTIANTESNSFIEAVWMAILEYIKWYNEQKISHISPHSPAIIP